VTDNIFWAFVNFHAQGGGVYGWDDKNIGFYPEQKTMVSRILKTTGFRKLTDTSETDYGTFAGYSRETFLKPTLTIEICKNNKNDPYPDEDFAAAWTPAKSICLIIAEEVLNMSSQDYIVTEDGHVLQAFCERAYADNFAAHCENAEVIIVKGGFRCYLGRHHENDMDRYVPGIYRVKPPLLAFLLSFSSRNRPK
jgi:hypothetical protein